MGGAPRRPRTRSVPAALRRTTTRLVARRRRAGRPRSTGRRRSRRSARRARTGAVRHSSSLTSSSATSAKRSGAPGQRAQDAEREHDPALHVDRARARSGARRRRSSGRWPRGRRRCRGARAGAAGPTPCRRTRASRSGAWSAEEHGEALDLRRVGQQRARRPPPPPRRPARRPRARRPRRAPRARARPGGRSSSAAPRSSGPPFTAGTVEASRRSRGGPPRGIRQPRLTGLSAQADGRDDPRGLPRGDSRATLQAFIRPASGRGPRTGPPSGTSMPRSRWPRVRCAHPANPSVEGRGDRSETAPARRASGWIDTRREAHRCPEGRAPLGEDVVAPTPSGPPSPNRQLNPKENRC